MTDVKLTYPALFISSNEGSANSQAHYLWAIRTEYGLLILVAALSSFRAHVPHSALAITLLLLVLGGLIVYKATSGLDEKWYRCRALAESVKTSTWRFCMRSEPFSDVERVDLAARDFKTFLGEILDANKSVAGSITSLDADQITDSMLEIRGLSLEQRLSYYLANRVDEQRGWYVSRSNTNKKLLKFWIGVTILVYVLAAVSINFGDGNMYYAFDPLIVLATSLLGWVQVRRYGELKASYNLTAHEIGLLKLGAQQVSNEDELSYFVNEAELAFSREHTQWVARKDS